MNSAPSAAIHPILQDQAAPGIQPIVPKPPPRLTWMDTCRGFAIAMVVYYHTQGFMNQLGAGPDHLPGPGHLHGEAGVDSLLLLSGFGLAYSSRAEPWHRFLSRRLWRLIPAYWLIFIGCWIFQIWKNQYVGAAEFQWKNLVYHLTCAHLIIGEPYAFGAYSALWFMGLIVPLYLVFMVVRPWVVRGNGYAALAWVGAIASFAGAMVLKYVTPEQWSPSGLSHATHRMPQFFLGAILGLAWRRRDALERFTSNAGLMWGLVAMAAAPVYLGYGQFMFYLTAGLELLAVGIGINALGERWKVFRPLSYVFAGLGTFSYEIYLCHQFLLLSVNILWLRPMLEQKYPQLNGVSMAWVTCAITLSAACWIAWIVRWIVAFKESRSSWRNSLVALVVTTTILLGGGITYGVQLSKERARVYQVTVKFADNHPPLVPIAEPVAYWGKTGSADMVFLEHDGAGRARIGIDHWGAASLRSDWVDAQLLTAGPWQLKFSSTRGIEVLAGPIDLVSPVPPHARQAHPMFGKNNVGFTSTTPSAVSKVEEVKK